MQTLIGWKMTHRLLTDPSLASGHPASSHHPFLLLSQHGPPRANDPIRLRQLVLDYLCHQCFVDTASAFATESASSLNQLEAQNSSHQPQKVVLEKNLNLNGSHSNLALKDTVIERTVCFDLDDDGDAEMGDLVSNNQDHQVLDSSNSSVVPPQLDPSATNQSIINQSNSITKINDISSLKSSQIDLNPSYPDWSALDIQTTRVRLEIKGHITNGRIKEAIKSIESHFPSVLGPSLMSKSTINSSAMPSLGPSNSKSSSKPPRFKPNRVSFTNRPLSGTSSNPLTPTLGESKASNLNINSEKASSQNLRQNVFKTNESNSTSNLNKTSSISHSHQFPHAIFGSLNPAHIALNLQIQFFVEFVRSISQNQPHSSNGIDHDHDHHLPPVNPSHENSHRLGKMPENLARKIPKASSPASHPGPSSTIINDLSNSVGGLSDDTSTTSSSVSTRTTSLALSLPHCRALHDFVHQLPEPVERAIFAKELENVAGLLAYVDPWDSPIKKYLDQSRRDLLAERVNAAILVHLGRSPTSILKLIAQQTCFTWSTLNELGERIPCPTQDDKNQTKPCNLFNLNEFVNLHEIDEP
ncbi:hypothetical protein O181_033509 [Austropuccinia psidii MF-1]|uniref:CRA domain-containing protein n=1 Tax=Austropuccinia psidii MF-1 TaxID=1389203 RepID=A0A9Q3H8M3_9BASI|nr:hypothetical protein [Austropuccinia psidii MF-1]